MDCQKSNCAADAASRRVDFWKGADPGMAEVEDAKIRLAGLKNH